MSISEMLSQSLTLTLLGMAVVFSFLIILVFSIMITSKVISKLGLDKEEIVATGAGATASVSQNNAVIAAIAAAVHDKQNTNT
ncbi:MAG TPA: OadG family protein [Treponemataceae bacterium]|nr:OadG family protein [Treponemataceae bacterium]